MQKIKNYIVDKEKRTKAFPYVLGFFGVASALVYMLLLIGFSSLQKEAEAAQVPVSPFETVKISAKSGLVIDLATGKVLYEKNADAPLPLASLTKLMTTATALETAQGLETIRVTDYDLTPDGDSGLFANSIWKLRSLLDYTLVVSSNDGAAAIAGAAGAFGSNISPQGTGTEILAEQQFIKNMNALAQTLGLTQSKFWNEHGLDRDENHVGAYGSARDMATLFKYLLTKYPRSLEATKYPTVTLTDQSGFVYTANNTNISVNEMPSLIASKTGFTDLAGGNLIIAFDAGLGRPIIISVLGSTKENRFSDVLLLASTTLEYLKIEQ